VENLRTSRYDSDKELLREMTMGLRVVAVLLSLLSCSLYALEDIDRQQLQQRIEPVGKVHVQEPKETQSATGTKSEVAASVQKKEPGQGTYEQYCIACHRDGVAGAPKFRDATDWNSRRAGRSIDELVAVSTKGLNAMPVKGTCSECTDADLKAAIQYMLPKS
jgi:cytochrome c5